MNGMVRRSRNGSAGRRRWSTPPGWQSEHMRLLRTLKALQYQQRPGPVHIHEAGQVNVGAQQVIVPGSWGKGGGVTQWAGRRDPVAGAITPAADGCMVGLCGSTWDLVAKGERAALADAELRAAREVERALIQEEQGAGAGHR